MSRRLIHLAREERGVAASEFALILPILTLLLFTFYEAGHIYWTYNTVQSSARDAARYAARMPMSCDGSGVGVWGDSTDQAEIQNLTRTGTLDGTGDPLVAGWTDNATVAVSINCVDNSSSTYSGRYESYTRIPTVEITASPPYGAMFAGIVPGFDISSITVSNAQAWTE